MAWRVDGSVIRGEIDNRTRGRVTGRIWFVGRSGPVELDFTGNAWRDLAGRRLAFVNPQPKAGELEHFAERQSGVIGDCTASRKVRVPDVDEEEFKRLYLERKPFPWHWANSLYLEWFSAANGRVVIESANFQLTVDDEVAWEMSPEEEQAQCRANAEALTDFMRRLGEAAAASSEVAKADTPAAWDDAPMTEDEAEKMQEESDRLADRINARVEREGVENFEKIVAEEIERRSRERGDEPLTPEQEARRAEWIEEMNRAAEEAANNPDPELEAELERKHPVAERAFELSLRLIKEIEDQGWIPAKAGSEHPVAELGSAVMSAGAKLAGALDGESWPPEIEFCASSLVRLKRARAYLEDAMTAADCCAEQALVEAAWLAGARGEIEALARECDALIGELRAKLERGFD